MLGGSELVVLQAFQHLDRQVQLACALADRKTLGLAGRAEALAGRCVFGERALVGTGVDVGYGRVGEQVGTVFAVDHWPEPFSDCACSEFGNWSCRRLE